MNDNEQFTVKRSAHCDVTAFGQRMFGIGNRERRGIAENSRSFVEGDPMFGRIRSCFAQIPFER
jgi:hypothetical protein